MIFRLIRHRSLGPGVVLSKEDGTLDVFFKDKKMHTILDNSMYFLDKKVNLGEFIKYELYEGIFNEFTKTKAKNYINTNHINRISIQGNKITGIVNGTSQYYVSILTKNNNVEITCNCPVKGLCKHEYAFLKLLKEKYFNHVEEQVNISKQRLIEADALSLYRLGNFSSLDSFFNIVDYLSSCKKEVFEEYILIFLRNKSPNFEDLIFYAISPLFFNDTFKEILLSLNDKDNPSVQNLVNKAYQIFLHNYVNPSKKFTVLASILDAIVCLDTSKLLSIERTVYIPSDFIQSAFLFIFRKKDFSAKELYEIATSNIFNYLNFYNFDSEINAIGKNKLAFVKWIKIEDEIFKEFDISELIPFLSISNPKSELISYLTNNFNKINPADYQLLVNNLYVLKKYHYSSRAMIDLVGKLPNNLFLFDLFSERYDRF